MNVQVTDIIYRRDSAIKREFNGPRNFSFYRWDLFYLLALHHIFFGFLHLYICTVSVFALFLNSYCQQLFKQGSSHFWIKTWRFLSFMFLSFIYQVSILLLLSFLVAHNFACRVISNEIYALRASTWSVALKGGFVAGASS